MGRTQRADLPWILGAALAAGCAVEDPAPPTVDVVDLGTGCVAAHDAPTPFRRVEGLPAFDYEPAPVEGDHWGGSFGAGGALGDFDGDGRVDVFLANRGGPSAIWWNRGGLSFEARTLDLAPRGANGASPADFDGDGDLDLYVFADGDDVLLRNRGDGSFEDVTADFGVEVSERTLSAAWGDLDGDGALDLFVCTFFGAWAGSNHSPSPDHLFLGDGEGGLAEAPDLLPGLDARSACFAAAFLPSAREAGRLDLLTVHDKGEEYVPDRLFVAQDGGWTELGAPRGVGQAHSGMGVAVADLDADGVFDVFKSSAPADLLLRGLEPGGFVDASLASGIEWPAGRESITWNADALDLDDDGDLDLLSPMSGYVDQVGAQAAAAASQVLVNAGDGSFLRQLGPDWGIERGVARASLRADLDGDGAWDLVQPREGSPPAIYQGRCSGQGFVRVEVVGEHCAREAAGATVEARIGGVLRRQLLRVGGFVEGGQPSTLHFGLGGAAAAEDVVVRFPCGAEVEVGEVPANRLVTVTEGG